MDNTNKRLPRNRIDLFKKLIRKEPVMIINLSLMMVLFAIPLVFTYGMLYTSIITLPEGSSLNDATNLIFFYGIFAILGFIVFYIGQGGLFYVTKKIVWNEPYVYLKHFMRGIKEQFKSSFSIGLLTGIIVNITLWGSIILLAFAFSNEFMFYVGLGALLLVSLLMLIISQLMMAQSCIYELSFKALFKNSLIFTILRLFKSILLFIFTYVILIGFMMIHFVTFIIGLIIFCLLNELIVLSWTLFSHKTFDLYINKEHYPNFVNKGLESFDRESENKL